jgi:hypothetical protein
VILTHLWISADAPACSLTHQCGFIPFKTTGSTIPPKWPVTRVSEYWYSPKFKITSQICTLLKSGWWIYSPTTVEQYPPEVCWKKNISFCCLSPILFPPHASPIIFANVPASFKTISSHSITAYINSSIYNQCLWFSNLSWFNYTFYWLNPSFEWLKGVKT